MWNCLTSCSKKETGLANERKVIKIVVTKDGSTVESVLLLAAQSQFHLPEFSLTHIYSMRASNVAALILLSPSIE